MRVKHFRTFLAKISERVEKDGISLLHRSWKNKAKRLFLWNYKNTKVILAIAHKERKIRQLNTLIFCSDVKFLLASRPIL